MDTGSQDSGTGAQKQQLPTDVSIFLQDILLLVSDTSRQ